MGAQSARRSGSRAALERFLKPVPAVAERLAAGKALRLEVPRASLATLQLPPRRKDPVAILEAQAKTRLQELIPVRYARMLTSPFAFLRGSAAVMAQDLSPSPVTGLTVQACGDMHLSNFGVFASAERNLVFGINDFDETLPASWEWDLKRLVASIVVAVRFLGGDRVVGETGARRAVSSYRERMREYAEMGHLQLKYETIKDKDMLAALSPEVRKKAEALFAKAKKRSHLQVLDKMTSLVNEKQQIIEEAPLVVRETRTQKGKPIAQALGLLLEQYLTSLAHDRQVLVSQYRVVDVARKVVGVGSVGTRCWVLLLQGASQADPLFLQFKEAQASVLAPYFKTQTFKNEGRRVVEGQRLIQAAPDIFLGWGENEGHDFYIRQLRDMKGSVEFDPENWRPKGVEEYSMLCGWALALAHAKSGDAAMIAGYAGKSDALVDALATFAFAYADQTDRDFDRLKKAAREKRIPVATKF
jgi:uncharacterized protein (DUF2252 family)